MKVYDRMVNDDGLFALMRPADEKPELFLDPDPLELEKAMAERARTENLWGNPLGLREELSPLNELATGGPGTDAAFIPLLRKGLGHLPPAEGLNDYRWNTINCFVIPQYTKIRWSDAEPNDEKRLPAFVKRHWLDGHLTDARQNNSADRLWWLGELSERAAKYSDQYDSTDFLEAMAGNVNLYHQLLYRRNLASRSKLVAAIYEVFLEDGNDYLSQTKYASEMMSTLNYLAADVSLDFMGVDELRDIVEEAKPPKGP